MSTGVVAELLTRNSKYAENHHSPPTMPQITSAMQGVQAGVVVLTCSDPRVQPHEFLGFDPAINGSIIRNAGGRALDAIRTIAVLQNVVLPEAILVIHHTDCGMTHYSDDKLKAVLTELAPGEKAVIDGMKFGEIIDMDGSIIEDVKILRDSPFIKKEIKIVGFKYDTFSGLLTEVK